MLEAVSPDHVLASFSSHTGEGVISLFADWTLQEFHTVKRFLPSGHTVSTVVLTDEPELAVSALRTSDRTCAIFPASLADLQPLVRIFANFRSLATSYGLTA